MRLLQAIGLNHRPCGKHEVQNFYYIHTNLIHLLATTIMLLDLYALAMDFET